MGKKRQSSEQVIAKLREAEGLQAKRATVAAVDSVAFHYNFRVSNMQLLVLQTHLCKQPDAARCKHVE